ncbi:MAG: hypothetical protein ACRDRE_02150, partial [Pseudonocardiaceae bacterium]
PLERRSKNTVKLAGVQVLMAPAMSYHKAAAACRIVYSDARFQLIAQWYPDMPKPISALGCVSAALHGRIS